MFARLFWGNATVRPGGCYWMTLNMPDMPRRKFRVPTSRFPRIGPDLPLMEDLASIHSIHLW